MYQEFYRHSTLLALPLASFLLFLAIFVGAIAWTYLRPNATEELDRMSLLPLRSDDEHPPRPAPREAASDGAPVPGGLSHG